jgi:hypothetical protein
MTTSPQDQDVATSIQAVLLDPDPDRAAAMLAEALRDREVAGLRPEGVARLAGPGRRAVTERVARAFGPLLATPLGAVLEVAWSKHEELRAAAQRCLASPGSSEVVELATHEVTSLQRPYVDLEVDGLPRVRLLAEVRVRAVLDGVLGVVVGGRLTEVRSGRATVHLGLRVMGTDVAERDATFDVPGLVDLGDGLVLATSADEAGAEPHPRRTVGP